MISWQIFCCLWAARFKWLIHSRLDLIWAAAHPPLSLLDQRIWVSPLLGAGDPHPNKFCLNDWHAIVPRSMAPASWLWWELMLQGSLPWTPHIEPGELLAGVLHVLELPLGEMDAVYCLEHCNKWSCQFKSWMPRKSRWRYKKSKDTVLARAMGLQSSQLFWQRQHGELRLVPKMEIQSWAAWGPNWRDKVLLALNKKSSKIYRHIYI